jgi:hypothetical protein
MHPVVRVSIKYRNNLRTQQSIFLVLDFIVHFSLYVSTPFGGHLQVVRKQNYIDILILKICLFTFLPTYENGT